MGCNTGDFNLNEMAIKVKEALENAGYVTKEGKPFLFGPDMCSAVIPAFGSCFGNNPAAPYIIPIVPHDPEELYEYGPSMQWEEIEGENGEMVDLYGTFRLKPDEAVVMFGCMPPEAAYLGFEAYAFSRGFKPDQIPPDDTTES